MYLVFDIETQVNKPRILDTEVKPGENPAETFARVSQEACDASVNCFIPARFHDPVVVVMVLLNDDLTYCGHRHFADLTSITKVVSGFWTSLTQARETSPLRLVSFNGTGFDIPVMQVAAMENRVPMAGWLVETQAWKDPRNGVNGVSEAHLDLFRYLANPGRIAGGLNFWSRLVGLPGKVDSVGGDVPGILAKSGLEGLVDYCFCDVANTWGLLMETMYARGEHRLGHRDPAYLAGVKRLFNGRGSECSAFLREYETSLINNPNALF